MTFRNPRARLVATGAAVVMCTAVPVASSAQAAVRSPLDVRWSDAAVALTVQGPRATVSPALTGGPRTRREPRGNPSAYSFIGRSGDAVARWNPCRRIGYRVNARLGGQGALADAREAVDRVGRATGLRFAYRGATRVVPGGRKDGHYPRDTQLVIAWARPSGSSFLSGGRVAGMGGPSWTSAVNRRGEPDLMITRGFAVLNARLPLDGGFGRGPRYGYQGTRGQLLMHEIGHAVGMGHAGRDAWQILYPTMTRKRAVWGAGDLRGLSRLGAGRGCLSPAGGYAGFTGPTTWSDYLR